MIFFYLSKIYNSSIDNYLFIFAEFLIFWALDPNLKVLRVSKSFINDGLTVIINDVKELPPRDSYKILVNFDPLYETKLFCSTI